VIESMGAGGDAGADERRARVLYEYSYRRGKVNAAGLGSNRAPRGLPPGPPPSPRFQLEPKKEAATTGSGVRRSSVPCAGYSPLHDVRRSARYLIRFFRGRRAGSRRLGPPHARHAQLVAQSPLHVQHARSRAGHRATAHREGGDDGNRGAIGIHDVHRTRRRAVRPSGVGRVVRVGPRGRRLALLFF